MANLLTQFQLHRNKSNFFGVVRAIKLLFLSAGLIYTIVVIFKGSFGFVITIFCGWLSSFSSSTLYIYIFIHLVIILIAVSSLLHRSHDGCVDSFEGCDLVSDFSSSMLPINLETHPGAKAKDIEVVASLENQADAVLHSFSRLSRAEEIREAQITKAGGRIREIEDDVKKTYPLCSSNTVKKLHMPSRMGVPTDTWEELEANDSMEATWRVIMKRTKAQEQQLMESEAWPKAETTLTNGEDHSEDREQRKSMTLNDAITIIRSKGGLRRDPCTNLEELNQRFGAFIQKSNRQIRLQLKAGI